MEINYSYKVLISWILVSFSTLFHIVESGNSSEITDFDGDENIKASNCSLMPERGRKRLKLDKLIDDNNRLIKLSITVRWNEYQPNETYPTDVFWFLATDTAGKRLLLLNDNFTVMSLGTLSHGVAAMQLTLAQIPENCLKTMTAEEADKVLKYTILTLPDTSKAVNEDGISTLHLCTGSVNVGGNCCNLTLTGKQVQCFLLADDAWLSYLSKIIFAVFFVTFMRIIYLIPKSVYADNKENSYTLLRKSGEQTFSIKLKMKSKSDLIKKFTKVHSQDISDKPLKQFREMIQNDIQDFKGKDTQDRVYNFHVKLESVKMDDDQLVSEFISSQRLSYSLYKTFSDIFLKCKIRNADFLRPIFRAPLNGNLRKSVFFNRIIKVFIFFFCLLPLIYRIIFIFKYISTTLAWVYLAVYALIVVSVLVISLLLIFHMEGPLRTANRTIVESLQILHMYDTEENMKKFILITLAPFVFKYYIVDIILVLFSFSAGIIFLGYQSFPLLKLAQIIFSITREKIKTEEKHIKMSFILLSYSYLILLFVTYNMIDFVSFYTECFIYILIGLLLNFDNVSNTILLILIVLTYAFDCLSRAYKQINHFNNRVMKVLCELIDTCSSSENPKLNQKEQMEKCVAKQHPNENQSAWQNGGHEEDDILLRRIRGDGVVVERQEEERIGNKIEPLRFTVLSQTSNQFITLRADGEGKPCLSTTGLILYYKFQDPENLPFMHVSERFFDELASNCGQLSPGPKYMILFRACKEIACLLLVLFFVFIVMSGFGRTNDISAGINTFVTIGSSTALIMINKLLFKRDEYSLYDHDTHLKALVEKHAKEFRDLWTDTSFNITGFNIDTLNVSSDTTEDIDIFVEMGESELTESWYVRSFSRNVPFPKENEREKYMNRIMKKYR